MSEFERSLPHSADAERAILGAIVINNTVIDAARAALIPEQFYIPSHRKIFTAMLAIAERKEPVEPIGISEELKQENALESVGGLSFITNLTYGLPYTVSIAHYVKIVRGKAALRQLIKSAAKITQAAIEEEEDPETIIANAENDLFALALQARLSTRTATRDYNEVSRSVMNLFEDWADGKIVAIPTQIPELDHRLAYGGFAPQDFIVIAARTSFGKTALALQVALNSARAGIPVLIFSLEMSAERLFIRNLSSTSDVPHKEIRPWTFEHNSVLSAKILTGIPKLQDLPFSIDDQTKQLRRMVSVAREWRRQCESKGQRTGLIITDYLQLVDNKLDKRSRQEEVASISIELKGLAKELNVPVIGVSQLNRKPATENRRPEESDLRESGQVGQDADLILLPWSEGGLKDEDVRPMKIYCPKQRNGSVGWEVEVDFDGERQWFFSRQSYQTAGGERLIA